MSNASSRFRPVCREIIAVETTPPAGPESTVCTGRSEAATALISPPSAVFPIQAQMRGIAGDDGEVIVLAAVVEADRQAEAIGQGQAIVHRVTRVQRVILFAGVPGHDGAPV